MEEVHNTHDPLMKKKDMMMRERKKSGLWNKRHARKPRSNKRASWWRSRKAGPGEKRRKPCCSLAQDLEETSYARLFFLYEPVTNNFRETTIF